MQDRVINLVLMVCSRSWTTVTKNTIELRIRLFRHAETLESDVLLGDNVSIKEDRFDRLLDDTEMDYIKKTTGQ